MRNLLTLSISSLALVASLTAVPVARAAQPQASITVQVDGIPQFAVQSWSVGALNTSSASASGAGVGKPQTTTLNITKVFDSSSPALFEATMTGNHIKTVTVTQLDSTNKPVMTVVLSSVVVTNYQLMGTAGTTDPAETVSFSFTKIQITDAVSGKTAGFDLQLMKGF